MKPATTLLGIVLSFALAGTAQADTYGSVEPIATPPSSTRDRSGTSRSQCARPSLGACSRAASWTR
jgi:hypothetical protein